MSRYQLSHVQYLVYGFSILAETCDPKLIDAAIKCLTELRDKLNAKEEV
jgi:hypothetical protein